MSSPEVRRIFSLFTSGFVLNVEPRIRDEDETFHLHSKPPQIHQVLELCPGADALHPSAGTSSKMTDGRRTVRDGPDECPTVSYLSVSVHRPQGAPGFLLMRDRERETGGMTEGGEQSRGEKKGQCSTK